MVRDEWALWGDPAMRVRVAVALALSIVLAGGVATSAVASTQCASGWTDTPNVGCTLALGFTGAPQMVTVPAGVGEMTVEAQGASGGTDMQNGYTGDESGGGGGLVQADIPVTGGQQLEAIVGGCPGPCSEGSGSSSPSGYGGYGGGGAGGGAGSSPWGAGGGGGGGAFVYGSSSQLLIAAGGGGGASLNEPGGSGGGAPSAGTGLANGGDGYPGGSFEDCYIHSGGNGDPGGTAAGSGAGGTSTGGGAGGAAGYTAAGATTTGAENMWVASGGAAGGPGTGPGTGGGAGGGGAGATSTVTQTIPANPDVSNPTGGGGGGGGYYGGGGGGTGCAAYGQGAGGGGSAYVAPTATNVQYPVLTATHFTGDYVDGGVVFTYSGSGASVSIADPAPVARPESGSSAEISFPVTLSAPSTQTVSVLASTADGTGSDAAVAGTDYQQTEQTLTFAPGSTGPVNLDVPLIATPPVAQNETFSVNLSDPANATIGTGSATGTILCSNAESDSASADFSRALALPHASQSPCTLTLQPGILQTQLTSGLALQDRTPAYVQQQVENGTGDLAGIEFNQTCVSGCVDIGVKVLNADDPPQPVGNAQVTATVGALSATAPAAVEPADAGPGMICPVDSAGNQGTPCGTSAIATTQNAADGQGIAQFRYYFPGVVNTGDLYNPNPQVRISFVAKGSACGCANATGSATLSKQVFPQPVVNEDVTLSAADLSGLQALLGHNKLNKKNTKQITKNIFKLLEKAKLVSKAALGTLKNVSDLAQSQEVDELLRRTPELVKLDWFMHTFRLTGDGLNYDTGSIQTWGRELSDHLIPLLAAKLPKQIAFLARRVSESLTSASKYLLGQSFTDQAIKAVDKLINRNRGGTMTLKLFEVSRCTSGPPCTGSVAAGAFGLVMAVSVSPNGELDFYESPNPIGYTPSQWLKAQCAIQCAVSH